MEFKEDPEELEEEDDDDDDDMAITPISSFKSSGSGRGPISACFYRECLKNHAVSMGGHAVDGCGEFMPAGPLESLKCAACHCHRNFHRKEILIQHYNNNNNGSSSSRAHHRKKRQRTKFTEEQKEKMVELAGKLGWKINKEDDTAVFNFCNETGLKRHVFKVWMHNNKHTLGKKLLEYHKP